MKKRERKVYRIPRKKTEPCTDCEGFGYPILDRWTDDEGRPRIVLDGKPCPSCHGSKLDGGESWPIDRRRDSLK